LSGSLKKLAVMVDLPFYRVDHLMFFIVIRPFKF